MATGIISIDKRGALVRLLDTLAAAQGAPGDGAAGDKLSATPTSTQYFDFRTLETAWRGQFGLDFVWPDYATAWIYEVAGSGTMTIAYARAWLYNAAVSKAFPAGIGADATKGYLNGGTALGETGSNLVRHVEPMAYPGSGDGINIELGTYGDASQRHNADLFFPAPSLSWRLSQEATLETMGRVLDRLDRLPRDYTTRKV